MFARRSDHSRTQSSAEGSGAGVVVDPNGDLCTRSLSPLLFRYHWSRNSRTGQASQGSMANHELEISER